MNVEDINIGDEVRASRSDSWLRVTHIEGILIVGRHIDDDSPNSWWASVITEVRRPKTPLSYEPVWHNGRCTGPITEALDSDATHVVTHWSDGTCTLDTIDAFREAHQ